MIQDSLLALDKRHGLPDALKVLLEAYPRGTWKDHDNFGQLVQFWMQRHILFRNILQVLQTDAQQFVERSIDFQEYAPRLSHYGVTLLSELHGHLQIEDHHYFPKLVGLDERISKGFESLETDHEAMDALLQALASGANTVLQNSEIGPFIEQLNTFEGLLERHLTDEEEIIVPVILHSGFRG